MKQPPPGTAEPQLGDSSTHLGAHSRGYLPHRDFPGILQFVTYRLADSLPASVLASIEHEVQTKPTNQRDAPRRRRIEKWLDAGHGSCVLRQPEAAGCVVDTWHRFAGQRYDLIAWVVMPNHVHVLIRVYPGAPLGRTVQSWKSFTGRRIAELGLGGPGRPTGPQGAVWMREYWDRFIRDERHFHAVVAYIHQNPVKAGLVQTAAAWPWSSAAAF